MLRKTHVRGEVVQIMKSANSSLKATLLPPSPALASFSSICGVQAEHFRRRGHPRCHDNWVLARATVTSPQCHPVTGEH